jgi:hypothetical protein
MCRDRKYSIQSCHCVQNFLEEEKFCFYYGRTMLLTKYIRWDASRIPLRITGLLNIRNCYLGDVLQMLQTSSLIIIVNVQIGIYARGFVNREPYSVTL